MASGRTSSRSRRLAAFERRRCIGIGYCRSSGYHLLGSGHDTIAFAFIGSVGHPRSSERPYPTLTLVFRNSFATASRSKVLNQFDLVLAYFNFHDFSSGCDTSQGHLSGTSRTSAPTSSRIEIMSQFGSSTRSLRHRCMTSSRGRLEFNACMIILSPSEPHGPRR